MNLNFTPETIPKKNEDDSSHFLFIFYLKSILFKWVEEGKRFWDRTKSEFVE